MVKTNTLYYGKIRSLLMVRRAYLSQFFDKLKTYLFKDDTIISNFYLWLHGRNTMRYRLSSSRHHLKFDVQLGQTGRFNFKPNWKYIQKNRLHGIMERSVGKNHYDRNNRRMSMVDLRYL